MTPDNWRLDAACAGANPETWFNRVDEAKAVCRTCAVSMECLRFALESKGSVTAALRYGVYGGLDPQERADLPRASQGRRRRRAYGPLAPTPRLPITHGTENGYITHVRRGEKACDQCREAKRYAARERRAARKAANHA